MSTKFTKNATPMKDSITLQLVMSASLLQDSISRMLVKELKKKGHQSINTSRLTFLSTLECGVNYASKISRKLKVSRQMVAKTVKELCELGYLLQGEPVGKQKAIEFTLQGEQLISECRNLLANFDEKLQSRSGIQNLNELLTSIDDLNQLFSEN